MNEDQCESDLNETGKLTDRQKRIMEWIVNASLEWLDAERHPYKKISDEKDKKEVKNENK
jgi:hypothetical protein